MGDKGLKWTVSGLFLAWMLIPMSVEAHSHQTFVPISVDDITVVVPITKPYPQVGVPDPGPMCELPNLPQELVFACVYLTRELWDHAGQPYFGGGENGQPQQWRPFFTSVNNGVNNGVLRGFMRYASVNGVTQWHYRYVPWDPIMTNDSTCEYAIDFGGTPEPRCHPNFSLRDQLLGFGYSAYGYDPNDPTRGFSGNAVINILHMVNLQEEDSTTFHVDPVTGAISTSNERAVTWKEAGRVDIRFPDGTTVQDVQEWDRLRDFINAAANSWDTYVVVSPSLVNYEKHRDRTLARATIDNVVVFSLYVPQNGCYPEIPLLPCRWFIDHQKEKDKLRYMMLVFENANISSRHVTRFYGDSYGADVVTEVAKDALTQPDVSEVWAGIPAVWPSQSGTGEFLVNFGALQVPGVAICGGKDFVASAAGTCGWPEFDSVINSNPFLKKYDFPDLKHDVEMRWQACDNNPGGCNAQ